jgi:hypothetical protein
MLDADLEQVSYIVGVDLGHGETALMGVNLKSEIVNDRAFKVEIDGQSNFITAMAHHPEYGILIGRLALTTDGVDDSFIGFKSRPSKNSQNRDIVRQYAEYLHGRLMQRSRYDFTDDNTYFYVGCPTDWARDKGVVAEYQSIFTEAGFKQVRVVAESRGALMNAVDSGDILATLGQLRGRALILDLGSSTADVTMIDLKERSAEPFDFGHDLGAALIDKMIFQETLEKDPRSAELIEVFQRSQTMRNRCELACRDAKEAWFNNPKSTPSQVVEVFDDLYFRVRLDEALMTRLLQRRLTALEGIRSLFGDGLPYFPQATWGDALRTLLLQAERAGGNPDIVLVTGGASRMGFVRQLCVERFPAAMYAGSSEPEYAIAAGLAYWGRLDLRTAGFIKAIDDFVTSMVRPKVTSHVPGIYLRLSEVIADEVTTIVTNEFNGWRSRRYTTVNRMKSGIQEKVQFWLENHLEERVRQIVSDAVADMGTELADEVKGLEREYGIPIGSLGTSFTSVRLRDLDVDVNLGSINFLGGVSDTLGNVIGVVAGLVTGVVTWVVTPIVLAIVLNIVAAISITLASALFAILISNPAGWAILAGVGIAAIAAGGQVKQKVQERVPDWDLPGWVRELVDKDSIHRKIRSHRDDIARPVNAALTQQEDTTTEIIDNLTQAFEVSLMAKADQARQLIT